MKSNNRKILLQKNYKESKIKNDDLVLHSRILGLLLRKMQYRKVDLIEAEFCVRHQTHCMPTSIAAVVNSTSS